MSGRSPSRVGNPHDTEPWEWSVGFYPIRPNTSGTAETFDQARAEFEAAWAVFLANRTEAYFQKWHDQRDFTAMWERGEKMPTQKPSSMMRCPCGVQFDSHDPNRGHIYDGIRQ